jgi:hypothetical protein
MGTYDGISPHILEAFKKFDKENEHVWAMVVQYAYGALNSGRQRFGIGMIWERLRWYFHFETTEKPLKLNNNYRSCYARKLMWYDPKFKQLLVVRKRK